MDGYQDSMRGRSNCYNGSTQLVQLKQLLHHRDEAGTRLAYSLTPQSQELLIYPSPRCLPIYTTLTLRDIIVTRLAGQKNSRHPDGGKEDGIENSDEKGFQYGDGIAPS